MHYSIPLLLQGVILTVVFAEIQCLGLCRDTLAGIIGEFTALTQKRHDTLLNAQHLFVIDLGAVSAIATGSFNFLAKQHGADSFCFFCDYTPAVSKMLLFFYEAPAESAIRVQRC